MKSFDFKFGTGVYGKETRCGNLYRLVVEPDSWRLTDLIIESGLVFKQHKVVPLAEVEEATAMGINLAVDCQQIEGYPQFSEMVVELAEPNMVTPMVTPMPAGTIVGSTVTATIPPIAEITTTQETIRQGIDHDQILLGAEVPVFGEDGRIGHLTHIITTNDLQPFQIDYLVVSEGTLSPRQFVVPIHYVQSLSEQGIHILANSEEIEQIPDFHGLPEDAEYTRNELREADEGMREEKDDKQVALAVEAVLMSDLRTKTAVIDVINERGVVTLTGQVPDRTAREAAETITRSQRGVIKVINELSVANISE